MSPLTLAGAVAGLRGAILTDVGRTLDLVELGLRRGDDVLRLHAQCPVRILRNGRILLGSDDMHWPQPGATDRRVAFDRHETMFDRTARRISEGFRAGPVTVREAQLTPDGSIQLDATEGFRVEVLPVVSGPVESWRLFVKGSDQHHVYPPEAP